MYLVALTNCSMRGESLQAESAEESTQSAPNCLGRGGGSPGQGTRAPHSHSALGTSTAPYIPPLPSQAPPTMLLAHCISVAPHLVRHLWPPAPSAIVLHPQQLTYRSLLPFVPLPCLDLSCPSGAKAVVGTGMGVHCLSHPPGHKMVWMGSDPRKHHLCTEPNQPHLEKCQVPDCGRVRR